MRCAEVSSKSPSDRLLYTLKSGKEEEKENAIKRFVKTSVMEEDAVFPECVMKEKEIDLCDDLEAWMGTQPVSSPDIHSRRKMNFWGTNNDSVGAHNDLEHWFVDSVNRETNGSPQKDEHSPSEVKTKYSKESKKQPQRVKSGKYANKTKTQGRKKRDLNPFFEFCCMRRTQLQCEHPHISSREVTQMLGEEWRQMSESDKLAFVSASLSHKSKKNKNCAIERDMNRPTSEAEWTTSQRISSSHDSVECDIPSHNNQKSTELRIPTQSPRSHSLGITSNSLIFHRNGKEDHNPVSFSFSDTPPNSFPLPQTNSTQVKSSQIAQMSAKSVLLYFFDEQGRKYGVPAFEIPEAREMKGVTKQVYK